MAAQLRGYLDVSNGCVVVRSVYQADTAVVVVWSREFSVRVVDSKLHTYPMMIVHSRL